MIKNNSWHLSKGLSIGFILSLLGMVGTGAIAWANVQRDIAENRQHIQQLIPKVTAIYEGLLVRGIIDPMQWSE